MISRACTFYFVFLQQIIGYGQSPNELLCDAMPRDHGLQLLGDGETIHCPSIEALSLIGITPKQRSRRS